MPSHQSDPTPSLEKLINQFKRSLKIVLLIGLLMQLNLLSCQEKKVSKEEVFSTCDLAQIENPKRGHYTKSLSYYLEDYSLQDFYAKRSDVWRKTKGWWEPTREIDSDSLIQCLSSNIEGVFLYIPNDYHVQIPIGWEYIKFFLVNNSQDTIKIPSYDNTVLNLKSQISSRSNDSLLKWHYLQLPDNEFEDNIGYWKKTMHPGSFMEIQLENDFLGYGDSIRNYRIELDMIEMIIYSNAIPMNFTLEQLENLDL